MPWFKVDDSFTFHPKVIALSAEAGWLWTRAGAWCAQQLTDGHVPARIMRALNADPVYAAELVEAGLWLIADEDGWDFHDWDVYQPSKEAVEAERAANRERQRKAREAAKTKRDGDRHAVTNAVTNGVTAGGVTAKSRRESRSPRPIPSQPVPTTAGRRKSATAIPADWAPNDKHKEQAQTKGIDLDYQATRFRNWAEAKDQRYVDWDAAFRNWLASDINGGSRPARAAGKPKDQLAW